ncbi:uncharacterized protein LOC121262845 isoform X3 [Juglans microcarpa x Juglans regia]|uniref:uncharacterized protein LOC121262845 isoform X3 n=1 Tax=Juglans microcarpa x Juglans regia TaxID=2249226 RepID=UPI001B7DA9CE|nr:uncharacterized protein LOC121262845 isoform X3 [Juglans microcarpa x Juglans regia]
MVSDLSDKEDELRLQAPSMSIGSSKRFKIPKKFFYDRNGVDQASVPRRLRSGAWRIKQADMKKRNHESVSPPLPDSKKVNSTISGVEESPIKNGVKKSKLNLKHRGSDWSPEQTFSGQITKEEEEVVETLYALAGMFPNNDANEKSKLDREYTEARPLAFPESRENPLSMQDSAVTNDDLSTMPWKLSNVTNPSSNTDSLPKETPKVDSLNEPSIQERPDLSNREKIHMESDCPVPQLNASSMSFLAKSDSGSDGEKPLRNYELSLTARLKLPTQPETPLIEKESEMAMGPVNVISKSKLNGAITIASEPEQPKMIKEPKKNGSALWPGLSSVVPHGVGSPGPSLQSPAAEVPGWLDTEMIARRHRSFENGSSSGEVSKVDIEKDTWKRCSAHVHISHLIQNLQMPENQGRLLLQSNQLKLEKGPNLGARMALNSFHGVRTSFNGTISSTTTCNSTDERNSNDAKTGILWQQQLHQDQPHAALASEAYTSQKQSFNFLSLFAGGGGMEAKNCGDRTIYGLDPSSQCQVPYLQSLAQQQTLLPFAMPQTRYTSAAYPDQLSITSSAANKMRVAPFLVNPFSGRHVSSAALTTQQQQQQQQQHQLQQHQRHQQQQHLWAAQLAAHYRHVATSISMTQISSWQQGRQDPPMLIPCAQASIPPSLEVLGPKYATASQQKQRLMAITPSLPQPRLKNKTTFSPLPTERPKEGSMPVACCHCNYSVMSTFDVTFTGSLIRQWGGQYNIASILSVHTQVFTWHDQKSADTCKVRLIAMYGISNDQKIMPCIS